MTETEIIEVLKNIFDPEIPVNIYDLGLIYKISITDSKNVQIEMTLTSPSCPVAENLLSEVENKISAIQDVNKVYVELVWEPTWNPNMMTEAAKMQLNML